MSDESFRPGRSPRPRKIQGIEGDPTDEAVIRQADALFGSEAASAIAYCGLDAWLANDELEFRRFARVFRKMRN